MTRDELITALEQTFAECLETCRAKNTDYAHSDNAWGNLGLVEYLFPGHVSMEQGVIVRLSDKLQRIAGATLHPLAVKDESFDDTCDDIIVYAAILKAMHSEKTAARTVKFGAPLRRYVRSQHQLAKPGEPLRIYIAGPYTGNGSEEQKKTNVFSARYAQKRLTKRGHYPHCPHAMTEQLDGILGGGEEEHEYFMRLDLMYIQQMMDAILRLPGESPGGDLEVKLAERLGLPIYHRVDEVPNIDPPTVPEEDQCEDSAPNE